MKKITLILLLFTCVTPLFSQDSTSNKFGKGLRIVAKDSSFYLKAGLRFQTLYNGELNLNTDEWNDNILIRRYRLKFDGYAYDPRLTYKLELGISNRDNSATTATNTAASIVLDAVLKYKFAPNWEVWLGQTKLPGNRGRVISSQALQFVDRSQLNSKFTIDRGTGIQLHHKHKMGKMVIREKGSISMGEGRNITEDNTGGYELTGRIELLPFGEFTSKGDYSGGDLKREQSPKLSIGVTYDQNNNTIREQGFKGDFLAEQRDQKTIFVDAIFKYNGFSSMFEYADKSTDKSALLSNGDAYVTGTGINFQMGYLFANNFEIAGRYTGIKPENNNWNDDYSELTLGLSRYIVGHHLKIQTDFTHVNHDIKDDLFRFRFQVELAF